MFGKPAAFFSSPWKRRRRFFQGLEKIVLRILPEFIQQGRRARRPQVTNKNSPRDRGLFSEPV